MKFTVIIVALVMISFNNKKTAPDKSSYILTKVHATLTTSQVAGSGQDDNSVLSFNFHHSGSYKPIAIITFNGKDSAGGKTKEGDVKTFDIPLQDTPSTQTKDDMGNTWMAIKIIPVGRDHYAGKLNLTFTFDDGTSKSFYFGDFAIGSLGESDNTALPISF